MFTISVCFVGSDAEEDQEGSFNSLPHTRTHSRTHSKGSAMSFTVSLGEQVSLSKDVFTESENECERENLQKSKFLRINMKGGTLGSLYNSTRCKGNLFFVSGTRCNLPSYFTEKQECIPVGCVPSAAVAVSPAMHAPRHVTPHHACTPATHTPCHACPCHTHFSQLLLRTIKTTWSLKTRCFFSWL